MNNLLTQESLNTTILAVTATLIAHGLIKLISRIQLPSGAAIGQHARAIMKFLPKLLNVLRYLFIFWLFAVQLQSLLMQVGPPTRQDTALIAFWVFWANLLFVVMMFDLGLWNVDRLLKRT